MWCFWSTKGGVGCSVTAVSVALRLARLRPALLVDLVGDVPAVLGWPESSDIETSTGLVQWLDSDHPPPDGLGRLEHEIRPNLNLLTWPDRDSASSWVQHDRYRPERIELLAQLLAEDPREVIVDVGQVPTTAQGLLGTVVLGRSQRSTLVTRACYLALRYAIDQVRPDDAVVIMEAGRSLRSGDVKRALGCPLRVIRWDPAIARTADAGLLYNRLPRALRSIQLDRFPSPSTEKRLLHE